MTSPASDGTGAAPGGAGKPDEEERYPPPVKRSVTLSGHRTSVSLEEPFWQAFREIAAAEGVSLNALADRIDRMRGPETSLASAIRLHVLYALRPER